MSGVGKLELERTAGELAVSGYMAKGVGKSLVRVFASTQVTNSKPLKRGKPSVAN